MMGKRRPLAPGHSLADESMGLGPLPARERRPRRYNEIELRRRQRWLALSRGRPALERLLLRMRGSGDAVIRD